MVKSALITGCSKGGIGDALAQEFHRNGIKVFATARDLTKIQHLQDIGLETLQLDVTSEESIQKAASVIEKETGGRLDFLVNNAGMGKVRSLSPKSSLTRATGYITPLLDADIKVARTLFDTNYWSALAMVQAFSPSLIAAKGKIINIGSIAGTIAQPYWGLSP